MTKITLSKTALTFDGEPLDLTGATIPAEPVTGTFTIDLTPTWSGILPALVAVLQSGTAEGQAIALDELRRMAALADSAKRMAARADKAENERDELRAGAVTRAEIVEERLKALREAAGAEIDARQVYENCSDSKRREKLAAWQKASAHLIRLINLP